MLYSSIQQWGPGAKPRQGAWRRSPQKLEHFLKYTAWNLMPGDNERHNLMPFMAFFYCSAHQHCVVSVSCCTMFRILDLGGGGAWPPKSALAIRVSLLKISNHIYWILAANEAGLVTRKICTSHAAILSKLMNDDHIFTGTVHKIFRNAPARPYRKPRCSLLTMLPKVKRKSIALASLYLFGLRNFMHRVKLSRMTYNIVV